MRRIAAEKAAAMQPGPGEVVLCADTTVALGRRILGKPADAAEAAAFLRHCRAGGTGSSRPSPCAARPGLAARRVTAGGR
jgi:predicted house-cleaning NTP pyrophosphatase (Maf/HAM1 superfamily)